MHTKTERRCVACRQSKLSNEMLRIARINGEFIIDFNHKIGGRGAYVCKDKSCISQTLKKHLLNKAFKTNICEQLYLQLGEYEQNN